MSTDDPAQYHGTPTPKPARHQVGTILFTPIKGKRKRFCETAGTSTDPKGRTRLMRCGSPASWSAWDTRRNFGVPVCEACRASLAEQERAADRVSLLGNPPPAA